MAILNGLYIHVVDEEVNEDVELTSHPVEKGIDVTDTVRARPITISLSGKIVGYDNMTAEQVLAKIKSLKNSGSLVEYRGRNVASNMQIQGFSTKHPNTNNGGADFSMELKQARIAKSSYVPKPAATVKREEAAKEEPVLEVGATVVFKGGNVYISSVAEKPAVVRGRSTCKITIINKASWSVHSYHLISKDGKQVYGWVNREDIEGVAQTSTNGKTNAGTQQTLPASKTTTNPAAKQGSSSGNSSPLKKYKETTNLWK